GDPWVVLAPQDVDAFAGHGVDERRVLLDRPFPAGFDDFARLGFGSRVDHFDGAVDRGFAYRADDLVDADRDVVLVAVFCGCAARVVVSCFENLRVQGRGLPVQGLADGSDVLPGIG